MPRIKVKAVFVSLEVKFKKAAQSLSVRVRTLQVQLSSGLASAAASVLPAESSLGLSLGVSPIRA